MTQSTQPAALQLANALEKDVWEATPLRLSAVVEQAAQELRAQHTQIAQLQAAHLEELHAYELTVSNLRVELEAVGKGQCLHQIAEPSSVEKQIEEVMQMIDDAICEAHEDELNAIRTKLRQLSSAQSGEQAPLNEDGYLPCPFCGSADVSESIGEHGDGTPWHYVECENCAATTEPETWNERASSHPAPALEVEKGFVHISVSIGEIKQDIKVSEKELKSAINAEAWCGARVMQAFRAIAAQPKEGAK